MRANRFTQIAPIRVANFRESETTIKIKFAFFRGGGQGGREEDCPKRYIFHGKRHDNKILKVKI